MSEMVGNTSPYTDVQRREAAAQYAVEGVMTIVSKTQNIPETTLAHWKNKTEWWDEIVAEVRSLNQDEHISLYQKLTKKSLDKASEAIDSLNGELSANDIKSLVITAAASTDKARLLLNQPTSISSNSASMSELQAQFEALAASHNRIESTVVSTQDDAETA